MDDWCSRRGLSTDDAEEVASAVLDALVRHMPSFAYDGSRSFRAWLRTIVNNETVNLWRREDRPGARGSGDTGVHEMLDNTEDLRRDLSQEFANEMRLVEKALERVRLRVTQPVFESFRLTAVEGSTGGNAAKSLGISAATVFTYKSRVLKMVKKEVEALNQEPGK